jgi:hypothetical protein
VLTVTDIASAAAILLFQTPNPLCLTLLMPSSTRPDDPSATIKRINIKNWRRAGHLRNCLIRRCIFLHSSFFPHVFTTSRERATDNGKLYRDLKDRSKKTGHQHRRLLLPSNRRRGQTPQQPHRVLPKGRLLHHSRTRNNRIRSRRHPPKDSRPNMDVHRSGPSLLQSLRVRPIPYELRD